MIAFGIFGNAPGAGKSTAADMIATRLAEITGARPARVKFSEPIKRAAVTVLSQFYAPAMARELIENTTTKDEPLAEIGASPRRLCVDLGQALGGYTARLWTATARLLPSGVYADDVRREAEAEAVRALGGVLIYVHRPGISFDSPTGKLEGLVDPNGSDYTIQNAGDYDALRQRCNRIANDLAARTPQREPQP